MRHRVLPVTVLLVLSPVALLACGGDAPTAATGADECSVRVRPGPDDQTAVQKALLHVASGQSVCLAAGTFHFTNELSLTSAKNVTVRGAGKDATVLDFAKRAGANGLHVYDGADGVTIQDLSVRDTSGDGIRAEDLEHVTFRRVKVDWTAEHINENGGYGLYPIHVAGVLIEDCEVANASDSGIYVGQSSDILVQRSDVHDNVAGIEIENSSDAEVRDNHAHGNVGGVLVFNLPGLPVQNGARTNVHDNVIEGNNLENFAETGTTVSKVPKGIGVIIVASDGNDIHDNTIRDNDSAGLALVSYIEVVFGKVSDPAFDRFPQANWIHGNDFSNNGKSPASLITALVPLQPMPDMLWDGCEAPTISDVGDPAKNCFSDNGSATFADAHFCTDHQPDRDISKVTCEHTPLPTRP